jgi:hypothetical protein
MIVDIINRNFQLGIDHITRLTDITVKIGLDDAIVQSKVIKTIYNFKI